MGPRSSATAASKSCELKLESCTPTQLGENSEGEEGFSTDHSRAEGGDLSEDAVLTDVQEGDLYRKVAKVCCSRLGEGAAKPDEGPWLGEAVAKPASERLVRRAG